MIALLTPALNGTSLCFVPYYKPNFCQGVKRMVWLAVGLVCGVAIGLVSRLPTKAMRLLDISVFASLAVMLFGLGVEVAQNPKLQKAVSNHALSVLVLLASVSLASMFWGWLLERGWSSLWRQV